MSFDLIVIGAIFVASVCVALGLSLFVLTVVLRMQHKHRQRLARVSRRRMSGRLDVDDVRLNLLRQKQKSSPIEKLVNALSRSVPLLNTTRLHNAVNACGTMARGLQLLRDYARRRVVFGEPLSRKPLHHETLAGLQTEYEAALALTFECLRLLGRVEAGVASPSERACLRLLTPVAKLATARFYMQRVLPDSAALHATILSGAGPVMEMDEAMF